MQDHLTSLLKPRPEGAGDAGVAPHRRDWRTLAEKALPWVLGLGFLTLLGATLGDRLLPARELTVATVVTVRQSADGGTEPQAPLGHGVLATVAAGDFDAPMLFQASGWIEPDPYPVRATALVDGVIDSVAVLEGELVRQGQVLASLIDDDARLDLATAEQRLASLEAQAAGHHRLITVAEAEIGSLEKQVAAVEAKRAELADLAERLQQVPAGSVPERDVVQARLELATQVAEVEALAVTEAEIRAKLGQLQELRRDYEARVAEARTDVDRKRLALDRTRIVSPIDGRVLRLLAAPGQKKMLAMDDHDSATVALLYNPDHLQARVDVPLAEAAQISVGQLVRVRCELVPDLVIRGRVTRIAGEADLQRNTLQVKVAIDNPDDRLRPEMLCRAEFLAAGTQQDSGDGRPVDRPSNAGARVQVFVPDAALTPGGSVWKVGPTGGRVVPQEVTLGADTRDGHRLVRDGLKPGDRVVLDPPADLEAGDRFRPNTSR